MSKFTTLMIGGLAGLALSSGLAMADDMLMAKNGMTLYTFDADTGVDSTCYDKCADFWPPYMAEAGATAEKDWTMVKRKDGTMQWAYDGHPLYFFKSDVAKGDAKGDGMKGVWHVVKE